MRAITFIAVDNRTEWHKYECCILLHDLDIYFQDQKFEMLIYLRNVEG